MFRDGLRIDGVDARVTGSFAPGDALTFDGTSIVSGSGGGGSGTNRGTATLDFGASFIDSASVTVTGQTWVTSSSNIHAWVQDDTTADNTADEHETLALCSELVCVSRSAGSGFTINAYLDGVDGKGLFTVHWEGA